MCCTSPPGAAGQVPPARGSSRLGSTTHCSYHHLLPRVGEPQVIGCPAYVVASCGVGNEMVPLAPINATPSGYPKPKGNRQNQD